MDLGIKGRKALVAGASKGLGAAVAQALAAEGCDLALCARSAQAVEATAQAIAAQHGVRVLAQAVDLSAPGQAAAWAAQAAGQLGGADILVTNAGGPPTGSFAQFSEEDWLKAVELTLLPAQALARAALPHMQAQKWGRVINLTSVSVKQPLPGLMLSNSIRAAVVGWAKSLADEVGPSNITVNNVCPGWIQTERVDQILAHKAQSLGVTTGEALASVVASIPLGRIGQPSELASLVAFLASERAAYITGVSYLVDGGLYRGLM